VDFSTTVKVFIVVLLKPMAFFAERRPHDESMPQMVTEGVK